MAILKSLSISSFCVAIFSITAALLMLLLDIKDERVLIALGMFVISVPLGVLSGLASSELE